MSEQDKEAYQKLLAELETIAACLNDIVDASFSDMEGAGMPDFKISEILWCELEDAANKILATRKEVGALLT